jgi:hypothetical protein
MNRNPDDYMYDEPEERDPVARNSDPDTSHAAPRGLNLREIQNRVLDIVSKKGPLTQHEVIAAYRGIYGFVQESTVRTRVSELREMGLVESKAKTTRPNGRQAQLWTVVVA